MVFTIKSKRAHFRKKTNGLYGVYPFTGQIVVNITTTTERLLACQY